MAYHRTGADSGFHERLSQGIVLEKCLFCKKTPLFRQWPGRQLALLEHNCRIVKFEDSGWFNEAGKMAEWWNVQIQQAKKDVLKEAKELQETQEVST